MYEITALLGEGGMGQVYRATDTKLKRQVAIKVLPPALAADRDRLARFRREAEVLASLNHTHIAGVYGLEDSGGMTALVMELIEGEDLADRIARGPIPLDEALPIAKQIAEALEAAHEQGIIHRDLKPANIKVRADGTVKLLDFGLARVVVSVQSFPGATDVSTATGLGLTNPGAIMGTVPYMSPEQTRGTPLDQRTDIWASGCVCYEMLAGQRAFPGHTTADVIAAVLGTDPDWARLPISRQSRLGKLLRHCLEKRPQFRLDDIAAAKAILGHGRPRHARRSAAGEAPGRTAATHDAAQAHHVVEADGARHPGHEIPHSLPAELDAFVGRGEELRQLATRLGAGQRLVTIIGMGGTGKTRFVRRYGWTWLGDWPGGVFFCDLSEARSVSGIASAVAAALDVTLGSADPIDAVGEAIAGRGKCLVILDNFEQVTTHASATVRPWLERAGEASFVVTSREILAVPGEHVRQLEPLPADGAGMELFVVRAQARKAGFALTASNAQAVRDIVSLLDGLPLAIELAAARTAVLSPGQLLARLQDRFQVLVGARGVPARQATLRAAIDWSWTLLAPWEQAALAQASVFVGGFTLDAAEQVLDVSAWPEAPPVLDVVQALVDKSLFRTWRPGADRRLAIDEPYFGMYVSIHEYAAEKLRTGEGREAGLNGASPERAATERHGRYFAHFGSAEALDGLDAGGGVTRHQSMALEFENLLAACRRAIARGDVPTAADAYLATCVVLVLRGPYRMAAELGRQVLQFESLTSRARGRVLAVLGDALRNAGQMDEALGRYEEALVLARERGDTRAECKLLAKLGGQHWHEGRLEEASRQYEAVLAIYRDLGNRRDEGIVLGNLGLVRTDQGRMEEARQCYEAALAIHRDVGNRRFEGIVLGNLGFLHFDQRRMEDAFRDLTAALAIHQEVGYRALEGNVLGNLGCVYEAQGRLDEAERHYEKALAIHREIGDRRDEGMVLADFGRLLAREGRLVQAREALTAGEAILRDVNNQWHLGLLLCSRSECERLAGDVPAARRYLADAAALGQTLGVGPDSRIVQEIEQLRARLASADGPG